MDTLRIIFIDGLKKKYGVNENLSRFLFDKWHVGDKTSVNSINLFLNSDEVRRAFFPVPEINRAKNYSAKDLESIGIKLVTTIDKDKRIFKDDKYGFIWREKFNGMADSFTGLFELIEPEPDDLHLTQNP